VIDAGKGDGPAPLWEVEVTCPDIETARAIARAAVAARLAACANILPGVESHYRWQGEVQTDAEVLLRLKTAPALFMALSATICTHHPYDRPAISALPAVALGPGVAAWLSIETGAP
jgi:periplasmic divalent cation tolerance protein